MKTFILTSMAALGMIAQAGFAWGDVAPGRLPILIHHAPERIFVPVGFDDNDNAQVVLDGVFPSTCFKAAPAKVNVDARAKVIHLNPQAYFYSTSWCATVVVPYTQVVDLGILPAGNYAVVVDDPSGMSRQMASLPIQVAPSDSPDDYLYAMAQEAFVENPQSAPATLVVRGTLGSSCMDIAETRVIYSTGNAVEILPIAELHGGICQQMTRPFEAKIALSPALRGRTLIHVRSLNGQALNQVVDF